MTRFFTSSFAASLAAAVALLSSVAGVAAPSPIPSGTFALTHVRVEVGDGSVIEDATVIVKDGVVSSVGSETPSGMAVVDATGQTLTPGLIETRTQIGTVEVMLEDSTVDHELQRGTLRPSFRVADGFNPATTWIPIMRKGGVTDALVSPTGGILSGQGAAFSMRGWPRAASKAVADGKQLLVPGAPDPAAPVAMFGNADMGASYSGGKARGGTWLILRGAVVDTLAYAKNKGAYDRGELRSLSLDKAELEAMIPVVRGQLPLVLAVDRAADILTALRFVDEMSQEGAKLNLVIAGAAEGWKVAGALAARKIPVIVTPSGQTPHSFDAVEARDDNPALLHAAGVPLILSTHDWDNNVRRLKQVAGIAVAWGLPRGAALPAITQTPARVFGLKGLGTVAKGQRANLVLWEGDPLECDVLPTMMWIDGEAQNLTSRQKELALKYGAGTRPKKAD